MSIREQADSAARKVEFSPADIRQWADQVDELASELRASADVMTTKKLQIISVDGATKITRGLQLISQFSANVVRSIRNVKKP